MSVFFSEQCVCVCVWLSCTVERERLGEGDNGDVPAVVVYVSIHKGQVAAVVNDSLHLRHIGIDGFVVDGAQQHTPAVKKAVTPSREDIYSSYTKILHFMLLAGLLREAVCCWDDPAVRDDGPPALVDSIVLEADLPRPTTLPGVHAADYTVCRKTTLAAVWGERADGKSNPNSVGSFKDTTEAKQTR